MLSAGIPKMPQGEFAAVGHSGPRSTSARVSSVALPGCELCIQNCWSATSAPLSCLVLPVCLVPSPSPGWLRAWGGTSVTLEGPAEGCRGIAQEGSLLSPSRKDTCPESSSLQPLTLLPARVGASSLSLPAWGSPCSCRRSSLQGGRGRGRSCAHRSPSHPPSGLFCSLKATAGLGDGACHAMQEEGHLGGIVELPWAGWPEHQG